MGYKALITLDLPGADNEKRDKFYEVLEVEKWNKIKPITTAWKASFNDDVNRSDAISILEKDLARAKTHSKVNKVEYAIQLALEDIVVNSI